MQGSGHRGRSRGASAAPTEHASRQALLKGAIQETLAAWARRSVLPLLGALGLSLGGGPMILKGAPGARAPLPRSAQGAVGSIRGSVYDEDFGIPVAGVRVTAVELRLSAETTPEGQYLIPEVPAGTYTLTFEKEDFVRQVKAGVVVTAGSLTEVDVSLAGEFTDLDEFVVQDVRLEAGSEAALLELRFESPGLLDSISSELMSRAGASDAGSALTLVSGATVEDGKFAVVRGLPDRYVSSQLNGVRLPSADEDKRAVELDQFPATVIESIQVSKTFTPDQQGDASGGAVDVRLKGIPEERTLQLKAQVGYNSQVFGEDDFLTYEGGGVSFLGFDDGDRDIQSDSIGGNWDGAAGVSTDDAPIDSKWSFAMGGKRDLDRGRRLGGFFSLFYERDSSFYDNGKNDAYGAYGPAGTPLTPEIVQGIPGDGDFKTALFDITQGVQSVQWGGLGILGYETDDHYLGLNLLYSHTAEDKATLAEDTRGKEYFFPGHDPDVLGSPGTGPDDLQAAPYIRTETLEYTERTTGSAQLQGRHMLDSGDGAELGKLTFARPELDWTLSTSIASLYQPDKRQFGSIWTPPSFDPGVPGFIDPFDIPAVYDQFKPSDQSFFGNFQRIWKEIDEDSTQLSLNAKWPFERSTEEDGYLKLGLFGDRVDRTFNQDTFSNFGDETADVPGDWEDDSWSEIFPDQDHPISPSTRDVDYEGEIDVTAWYAMADFPVSPKFSLVGGARFESTDISVINDPEDDATWLDPQFSGPSDLEPGEADVDFSEDDVLPSIGLVYEPVDSLTLRASYGRTVARQTFKELTPILQSEFYGGPTFVGNPELQMSSLDNYDLRADYVPYAGGLWSLSWFAKDIDDPIEYVQTLSTFKYTTAKNYPQGELSGVELEVRQHLGEFRESLDGLRLGANATFIRSSVDLPADEIQEFTASGYSISSRDMLFAPEHLYNLYATYDVERIGAKFALFYTVKGDTLVAGAGAATGLFVPDIYATEVGKLNFSYTQRLSERFELSFQAKNLTNPTIEEVYRSEFSGPDVVNTSYSEGREFSVGLSFAP